jgi:hypothetical protein
MFTRADLHTMLPARWSRAESARFESLCIDTAGATAHETLGLAALLLVPPPPPEAELDLGVDVIVCAGETAARAAKGATSRIPIVMLVDGDPVRSGLVTSLGRPGGNITGMTSLSPALNGKRLELLQQAVPNLARVAVLRTARDSDARAEVNELEREANALTLRLHWLDVRRREDFEPALKTAIENRDGAMLVLSGRVQFSQAPLQRTACRHYFQAGTMLPLPWAV